MLFQVVTVLWYMAAVTAVVTEIFADVLPGTVMASVYRAAVRLHQELWIAAPVGVVGKLFEAEQAGAGDVGMAVLGVGAWWYLRNWPDDNVWKRRGRRLRERVVEHAGRLAVVPEVA